MRLKHHRLILPFAPTAAAAMLAMAVALVWGTGVSAAYTFGYAGNYFEDSFGNLCVGVATSGGFPAGSCEWQKHITFAADNVALGESMMPFLTEGEDNVALQRGALASDTTGPRNIAIGREALFRNTIGGDNFASGEGALRNNTEGEANVAIGREALGGNTKGSFNTAIGYTALGGGEGNGNFAAGDGALKENKTGEGNIAIGESALSENTSGSRNVAFGFYAGTQVGTNGNANIDILNAGHIGDEFTTRIGVESVIGRAFVGGIFDKSISTGPACNVKVDNTGQLGCHPGETVETAPTAIAIFDSFGGVPSGNCLFFGGPSAQGQGACPGGAPNGWSTSRLLAGPIPDHGAMVSYLHAETEKPLTGGDSVGVEVIDKGAMLQKCTVKAPNASCTEDVVGGAANPGDNLEVRVTANPPKGSGNNKPWRVSFRY